MPNPRYNIQKTTATYNLYLANGHLQILNVEKNNVRIKRYLKISGAGYTKSDFPPFRQVLRPNFFGRAIQNRIS